MKNEITTYETHTINGVEVVEIDGWFKLADVARAIGVARTQALRAELEGHLKRMPMAGRSGPQGLWTNLDGLMRLATKEGARSTRAARRKLMRWVVASPCVPSARAEPSTQQRVAVVDGAVELSGEAQAFAELLAASIQFVERIDSVLSAENASGVAARIFDGIAAEVANAAHEVVAQERRDRGGRGLTELRLCLMAASA